jgi:hypothetical protein
VARATASDGRDYNLPVASAPADSRTESVRRSGLRADLLVGFLALGLVAAANLVITWGHWYTFFRIFAWAPPLFAYWHPHVGPGTPLAVIVAVAVVARGPELAERLRWTRLVGLAYAAGLAWTFAVLLVDGWQRGIPSRIATGDEYLVDVPRVPDIPEFLRTFTSHILSGRAGSWVTHVSGHPPGATLVFVWLDRVGLGGAPPAALACVLVGGLTVVAVPVTIRLLGNESAARAVVPFLVLLPGGAIAGVSADWLFAGVSSTGVALLALGAVGLRAARPRWPVRSVLICVSAGLVLGFCVFLSYGLVLFGLIPLAVLVAAGGLRAVLPAVVGVLAVVAIFTVAGFWWLDGYHLVIQRYYQDLGATRPYDYWVWADLACLVLICGPVFAAGLRRGAVLGFELVRERTWNRDVVVPLLTLAAVLAVAVADESGLSKAETERIWLPFAVWLVVSASLLPARHRRWWLVGQVLVALVVKHLLWTQW